MKRACLIIALFVALSFTTLAQAKKKSSVKNASPGALAAQMASGKKVFTLNCLVCHQVDGLGLAGMYPPLSKTTYVLGPKATIIKIIIGGFSEQIDINGDTYTNAMPSFGIFTDKEVADVLTYVRNSFGNKASAISRAEVKAVRAQIRK